MSKKTCTLSLTQKQLVTYYVSWRLDETSTPDIDDGQLKHYTIDINKKEGEDKEDALYRRALERYSRLNPDTDRDEPNYKELSDPEKIDYRPNSLYENFDAYWTLVEFYKLAKKLGLEDQYRSQFKEAMQIIKAFEYYNYKNKKVHPARKGLFIQLKTEYQNKNK